MLELLLTFVVFFNPFYQGNEILFPKPEKFGKVSIEETLSKRRTIRNYSKEPIQLKELGQLLWAAQGITSDEGFRTAPSAGALYPLEIFIVTGNVEELEDGIYRYNPTKHSIIKISSGDKRKQLADAALGQEQIQTAAVNIIITAVLKRTTWKYGERGKRYVHIEVGHSAQNVMLQAEALGIGVCPVGAFQDEKVQKLLGLTDEEPLYILTVGKK
jgi:SagB-type dehydrogenase family enzyme